jgi:hypothetical protein
MGTVNKLMDKDYQRDLAIKIMDYIWYEYLQMTDDVQDYDFHMQDTILDIIKKHFRKHGGKKRG